MTTASVTKSETARPAKAQAAVELTPPSRREFLYYIWGASIALLLGETTAGIIWFSLPRFKAGEFGGTFTYDGDSIPTEDNAPIFIASARFWLSTIPGEGFLALYGVCTHLGCLPKWVPTNNRFECPCHGSKYQKDGHYIEGPAPRSLDRFKTVVTFDDGSTATNNATGDAIPLDGKKIASVSINTGARIKRNGRV